MVERLRKPGTVMLVAVVCLASAVGNGLNDDFSNLATIVFSVLGSLFLAAAIVSASVVYGRTRHGTGRDRLSTRPSGPAVRGANARATFGAIGWSTSLA